LFNSGAKVAFYVDNLTTISKMIVKIK